MTVDKCKFRKPVEPGDTVEYHMTKLNNRRNMWWYRGEAKVDGTLVCEAEVSRDAGDLMSGTVIHPSAVIEDGARIGAGVKIGPFCMVGPDVSLGDGCELDQPRGGRGPHDHRRADQDLSLRFDRPPAAGPQICRRTVGARDRGGLHHPRRRHHEPRHGRRQHEDGRRRPLPVPRELARGARLHRRQQRHLLQQRDARRPLRDPGLRDHRRRRGRTPVRAHRPACLHRRHVGHRERRDPLRHGDRQPRPSRGPQHHRPAPSRLHARSDPRHPPRLSPALRRRRARWASGWKTWRKSSRHIRSCTRSSTSSARARIARSARRGIPSAP